MLQYLIYYNTIFLNSSVVEQSAVNRLVVGSNPTWGDLKKCLLNSIG